MNFSFSNQPPIYTAEFAFAVIFAVFSFLLLLVFLLTGIKMTRKPSGDAFGTDTEQEIGLLRLHRARFAVLMALSLISLVIVFSTQAASYILFDIATNSNISMTYIAFWDIRNVFFSAVLIAVLDSGIKVSQFHRYSSAANGKQGGTNVNIIVMSCIVGFLAILTIARIVATGELYAEYLARVEPYTITVPLWWAQFGLAQVHNFFNVVLSIYYTIVTILMWRKKRIMPHESNEADKNYSFRVLDRVAILVCPLLLLLTLYTIISIPIENTIILVPFAELTPDQYLTYLSFSFAGDFIWGVITIGLNAAVISVGYVL
ncbi:hypothetical protein M378DRAFT_284283 [Amanita muscaria Koide BX008]|uniref:Uncharacterized protein n=1 Tax=Amanita muscaria (strain Koide BX008) TaxID=946122 RepID=A0A0C2WRW1_AMAMK|nr:hypothetical protein M378DRAFT_284283 [Amanita muscaria Koide BX008]